MMNTRCDEIEPLLTPWVDDEIGPDERTVVERHLAACPACAAHAAAERGARALLAARRDALKAGSAPAAFLQKLRAAADDVAATRGRQQWRRGALAVAATLLLVFSGVTLHLATVRSTTVLAAQLAADHVKCHFVDGDAAVVDPRLARDQLAVRYGLQPRVPPGRPDARLRLVGARRCLTGEGRNAHLLYRYEGRPVSLYLVPDSAHAAAHLDVLGQRAITWTRHNGTYVLVAERGTPELSRLAAYMQQATE